MMTTFFFLLYYYQLYYILLYIKNLYNTLLCSSSSRVPLFDSTFLIDHLPSRHHILRFSQFLQKANMSGVLNVFHKLMATGLIGATAFGFYVFGDMGYGIVQRHNERKRPMEEQQEPVNLDDLPKPTDENT